MTQNQYLADPDVNNFKAWIIPKLSNPNSFAHTYIQNGVNYNFDSIYSAFLNYSWHFNFDYPITHVKQRGNTFLASSNHLNTLSVGLRNAIITKSNDDCIEFCRGILQWGLGSSNAYIDNRTFLNTKLFNITHVLKVWSSVLNLDDIDLNDKDLYRKIHINAGFTKIFSLIVNDFIIYDSRVGAALCLLVRQFCVSNNINSVPIELCFAWDIGKTSNPIYNNRRNPNQGNYKFPKLSKSNWLEMNIKASWLLKDILRNSNSNFNNEPNPLRSFEAALFMIGYQI